MSISLILLILALICFILAAAGISSKINLVALGLAFWVLTLRDQIDCHRIGKVVRMIRSGNIHRRPTIIPFPTMINASHDE